MMIWIILLAMTALAVMAVLWPLSRHAVVAGQADPDTRFYREQIGEIDRDRARGALLPAEAELAKAEAARRLLRANRAASVPLAVGEPALRRRRVASTLALSVLPIMALAVYGALGSPHITEELAKSAVATPATGNLEDAVAKIESHLAANPQDGRGWDVIAPVYVRMGRMNDAVKAYESALRHLGPDAVRLTNYGEALVIARDGLVSRDAQVAFEKAVALDPSSAKARLYLARATEQDGQIAKARNDYAAILKSSPPDAPWAPLVREQIARLDAEKATPPDAEAIAGMVSGLALRLETEGGSADEWARLIRSYSVLGERDKARDAAMRARRALANDAAGLGIVDAMARDLQLTDATP